VDYASSALSGASLRISKARGKRGGSRQRSSEERDSVDSFDMAGAVFGFVGFFSNEGQPCPPPKVRILLPEALAGAEPPSLTLSAPAFYTALVSSSGEFRTDEQVSAEGTLPPGVVMNESLHRLEGFVNTPGTYTFTVIVSTPLCRGTNIFTIIVTDNSPKIIGSLGSARPGETITITGTNLCGVTNICFNGVCTTNFTIHGCTNISVVVPANASTGHITLSGSSGSTESDTDFIVPPAIDIQADIDHRRVIIDYQSGEEYLEYAPALTGPWNRLTDRPPVSIPITDDMEFFRVIPISPPGGP
jgi:hypothetical protein